MLLYLHYEINLFQSILVKNLNNITFLMERGFNGLNEFERILFGYYFIL